MKEAVRIETLGIGDHFKMPNRSELFKLCDIGTLPAPDTSYCVRSIGGTVQIFLHGDFLVIPESTEPSESFEKNLSLLRPLDPAKLKQGDNVLHLQGEREVTYIAGPDEVGSIVVRDSGDRLRLRQVRWYRMKPLLWIAGRPVYPGDELYLDNGKVCKIEGLGKGYFAKDVVDPLNASDGPVQMVVAAKRLSWDRPKVKKEGWINIYSGSRISHHIHETEAYANQHTDVGRIACVRVEWEE